MWQNYAVDDFHFLFVLFYGFTLVCLLFDGPVNTVLFYALLNGSLERLGGSCDES